MSVKKYILILFICFFFSNPIFRYFIYSSDNTFDLTGKKIKSFIRVKIDKKSTYEENLAFADEVIKKLDIDDIKEKILTKFSDISKKDLDELYFVGYKFFKKSLMTGKEDKIVYIEISISHIYNKFDADSILNYCGELLTLEIEKMNQ